MSIEAMWDRVERYGGNVVEIAAWKWATREMESGSAARAFLVEAELALHGLDGIEALWEMGALTSDDVDGIVSLADARHGFRCFSHKPAPA
ncbi:hypothetical protein [Microbacterium testaceum]|uniref:hypothetical protein n=1 Tax=Microbacterium testaceum TaxID=2033 RepID=UPI00381A09CC